MLLLHVCCADCGLKLMESIKNQLKIEDKQILIYFYNPNIHPRSEWLSRQAAVKKILGKYKIVIGDWEPKKYFGMIAKVSETNNINKNTWPQKEIRCSGCWQLRLEETFKKAKELEIEMVSTSLFASAYQNFGKITEIGLCLSQEYQVKFWGPGEINRSKKTSGFYKQNYCGCSYSLVERMEDKYIDR